MRTDSGSEIVRKAQAERIYIPSVALQIVAKTNYGNAEVYPDVHDKLNDIVNARPWKDDKWGCNLSRRKNLTFTSCNVAPLSRGQLAAFEKWVQHVASELTKVSFHWLRIASVEVIITYERKLICVAEE